MKKLLFPLMLTVTGNTFTAPKPQKTKSTRNSIASRILESEKKRDWGSSSKRNKTFCRLCYKLWNYGSKKKYWRRGIWTIFWKRLHYKWYFEKRNWKVASWRLRIY